MGSKLVKPTFQPLAVWTLKKKKSLGLGLGLDFQGGEQPFRLKLMSLLKFQFLLPLFPCNLVSAKHEKRMYIAAKAAPPLPPSKREGAKNKAPNDAGMAAPAIKICRLILAWKNYTIPKVDYSKF